MNSFSSSSSAGSLSTTCRSVMKRLTLAEKRTISVPLSPVAGTSRSAIEGHHCFGSSEGGSSRRKPGTKDKTKKGAEENSEARQVRETGDWSSDSKLSAIHSGYWEDPFFRIFNPNDPAKIRRTSLICRGYYVRFRVCDYFLRNLIKCVGRPVQVVSLGAGMDSCFFRILPELETQITKFFEIDFKSVIKTKEDVITHNPLLRAMSEGKLKLLACDLRQIVSVHETLKNNGFDFDQPTVFYSECVVNYLGTNENTNILEWITSNVPNSLWLAYEQCNALDSFGQIMLSHFLKNGCPLLSLISAHSREDQETQLRNAGFKFSQVINAWDAFVNIGNIDPPHFPRLKNSDHQFDEYEQLIATCLHYSVRVGLTGKLSHIEKITELLDRFHLNLVPPLNQPGVHHECIKDSLDVKLDVIEGAYLPTLSGHETTVINKNTLLTLGGSGENSVRMKHLIRSRITFETGDRVDEKGVYSGDPFQEEPSLPKKNSISALMTEVDIAGVVGPMAVKSKILLENADHYERIHACAIFVPSSVKCSDKHDSILIFGGRKSPRTPCSNDLIELNVNKIDSKVNIASVIVSSKFDGSCPQPRWRHSMTLASKLGSPYCLLFGGRNDDQVLGDCWWYNVDDYSWHEIYARSSANTDHSSNAVSHGASSTICPWPGPRHSHAMTADLTGDIIYMIGGISENDTTLCEDAFWTFDTSTDHWTNIEDWNNVARRVGHALVKTQSSLLIIGGYGADSSYGFDFLAAICDLECNTVKIVTQTLPLHDTFLPFGFTASLLKDDKTNKDKVLIFGGGGNCFSFGTHYNQVCYVLNIQE